MFQIAMPWFTVALVSLAAFIYCSKFVIAFSLNTIRRVYQRYAEEAKAIHDRAYDEVKSSFDFWWTGAPAKTVRAALLGKLLVPEEIREHLPDQVLDSLLAQAMDSYRIAALHLAIHARMKQSEGRFLNTLPKLYGLRQQMLQERDEHEETLEDQRTLLISVGVDVEALETDFSAE